tara:strand:+ start:14 stop:445 length:432 start_codon:yes stop_codon:yes gene_type:complete
MPSPHRTREIARQESGHHRVVALSAAATLTDNDGGTYFTVTQASEYDITLPTISQCRAGWWADFTLVTAGSNDVDIAAATADADKIWGLENSDTATNVSDAADKVTFAADNAGVGDFLHIWTDGTNWYFRQSSVADNGASHTG